MASAWSLTATSKAKSRFGSMPTSSRRLWENPSALAMGTMTVILVLSRWRIHPSRVVASPSIHSAAATVAVGPTHSLPCSVPLMKIWGRCLGYRQDSCQNTCIGRARREGGL